MSPALSRRQILKLLAASSAAAALSRTRAFAALGTAPTTPSIAPGPFAGTRESLRAYRIPQWFRDAKFGIWAHWGPQSAPEYGDWYARNIYIDSSSQAKFHRETYGHPSKFGYKDIIPLWRGDKFDADHLLGLYKAAGAKYFMTLAVHCDNFDLWDSRHQPKWNSVNLGPRRNIVAEFAAATRRHGLRFGLSDHLWPSSKWISMSRGTDRTGDLAGVPYDGVDPQYRDLYGDYPFPDRKLDWNEDGITDATKAHWFERIKDLVDQHHADIIYQDGHIPFGDWGLALVAHYYNRNLERNDGRLEAVYTSKRVEDTELGECVLDFERAVPDRIWPQPWQICTCVGGWHYDRRKLGGGYKTPKRVVDMLVDTVARNGNLLLNFPLRNDGTLDDEEKAILAEITAWMKVNGPAIYATRPWKILGDGPQVKIRSDPKVKYNEALRQDFTAEDVRYTTLGRDLFAFVMGVPDGSIAIPSLARGAGHLTGRIEHVELLGHHGRIDWKLEPAGLRINLPPGLPHKHALAFKLSGPDLV